MTKSGKKDIDALFAKVKKTAKVEKPVKPTKALKMHAPKGSASDPLGKGDNDNLNSGKRRYTEEGWPIYKEDELKLGNAGGDTALCPFDCECCF
jgi:hypothetical protein